MITKPTDLSLKRGTLTYPGRVVSHGHGDPIGMDPLGLPLTVVEVVYRQDKDKTFMVVRESEPADVERWVRERK